MHFVIKIRKYLDQGSNIKVFIVVVFHNTEKLYNCRLRLRTRNIDNQIYLTDCIVLPRCCSFNLYIHNNIQTNERTSFDDTQDMMKIAALQFNKHWTLALWFAILLEIGYYINGKRSLFKLFLLIAARFLCFFRYNHALSWYLYCNNMCL